MEEALKTLFSADKNKEGYSFQLVVWDNGYTENWDDEFVFHSEDMIDDKTRKRVTKKLLRFMDTYKKVPIAGRKARAQKKKDTKKNVIAVLQK